MSRRNPGRKPRPTPPEAAATEGGGLAARPVEAGPRGDNARESIRCFIALQPDEAARLRLDELAAEQQRHWPAARRMRAENLHLTLAFIGALEAARARQVAARLAALRFDPFDWTLDTVGSFGRARVLWAGGSDARLDALASQARRLLDDLDISYDRKPFVAHVTLLRKLPRAAAQEPPRRIAPPIPWRAQPPVLLESRAEAGGTRYVPVSPQPGDG